MATKQFKSFGKYLTLVPSEFLMHLEALDPGVLVTVTPWDSRGPHHKALGVHYIEARKLVEWFSAPGHLLHIQKVTMRAGRTHHCVYEVDFKHDNFGAPYVMFNVINEQLSMEYRARI